MSSVYSVVSSSIPRLGSHAEPLEVAENAEKSPKTGAFCRFERSLGREKKGSILHQMGEAKTVRQTITNVPNLRVSAPLREINTVVWEN